MRREIHSTSAVQTQKLGEQIGRLLQGGEIIELISDLGGGKTEFVRGMARGIDSDDEVMSPTFTIERLYRGRDELIIHHFDFYRLGEAGVVGDELIEAVEDEKTAVAIEWGEIVHDVLPAERLIVQITSTGDTEREIVLEASGKNHERLLG